MTYTFGDNYKSQFSAEVTKLIEKNNAGGFADRVDKMVEVQRLTDAYIDQTGETPEASELERLTDAILSEELKSMYRAKAYATEYPFLSERQMMTRISGEASFKLAEETGTDWRSYAPPKRRERSPYENRYVDIHAKIRNIERKRKYRIDTAPGPVETYKRSPEEVSAYLEETYGYRRI